MLCLPSRLKNRSHAFISIVGLCAILATSAFAEESLDPFARARKWLENQVLAQKTGSLLLSYSKPDSSRSFIYDQALAIVAFTILTDYERAANLIQGLMPLLEKDGSLQFSYDAKSPCREKQAMVRTGALAWVGYSVCFYLDASGDKKDKVRFLAFAKKIARYIRARQIRKKGEIRQGLVTGGRATFRLQVDPKTQHVSEVFVSGPVTWCSTEHNLDTYFFLKLLERLTGKRAYGKTAGEIKESLLQKCWDEHLGQFIRGVNLEEQYDRVLALDCASWGGIFLLSNQEQRKLDVCLPRIRERYYNEIGGQRGYKAYFNKLVYENYLVGLSIYPDNPKKTWAQIKAVWPEGTMGVATLFLKVGKNSQAEDLFRDVEKMQEASGGILYHSMVIPFEFEMNPSVASTAWYIMARMMAKDERLLKKFWE